MASFNDLWQSQSKGTSKAPQVDGVNRRVDFSTLFNSSEKDREELRRQQKELDERRKKANDYKEKFFKQSQTSQVVDGITNSLLRAAQRGDQEALEKYQAITNDERMKPFRQPLPRETDPQKNGIFTQVANRNVPAPAPFQSKIPAKTPPKWDGPVDRFKQVGPQGPQLSVLEQASVSGGGLINALSQPFTRSARGVDRSLRVGQIQEVSNKQNELLDNLGNTAKMLRKVISSETSSPEAKENAIVELNKVMSEMGKLVQDQGVDARDFANYTSNSKNIAAGVELLADLGTAGAYKTISTATKGASLPTRVGAKTTLGMTSGGVVGTTGAIQNDTDPVEGAMTGVAFGGLLGLLGSAGGELVRGARNPGTPVVKNGKTVSSNPLRNIPNPIRAVESQIAPAVRKVANPLRKTIDKKAPGVGKAIDFMGGLIDKTNEIKKPYRGLKDLEGEDIPRRIEDLVTDARSAVSTGSTKFIENKYVQQLKEIFEAGGKTNKGKQATYKELSDFIAKKQDAINANKMAKKGAERIEVPVGNSLQERAYRLTVQAYKEPVRELYRAGMIDKPTYQKWMKDESYVRIQRNIDDLLDKQLAPKESERLNKSKNIAEEKLQGSDREIQDIFSTMEEYYQKAYTSSTRRTLAKYIKDVGQQHGIIGDAKVSAKKVQNRTELWEELKESRGVKKKLLRSLRTKNRQFRKIESEFNKLNKEGLEKALKKLPKEDQTGAFNYKTVTEVKTPIRTSKPSMKTITAPSKITGTATTRLAIEKGANPKKTIESLIKSSDAEYNLIKKKILNRDKKLKTAFDEIDTLRNDIDIHTELNKKLYQAIKDNADESTKNTNTLKVWQDGVRELYEIDPGTFRQLNNVADVQINGLVKGSMYASRILRSGATAANAAFALKNIIRDQFSSFINSDDIFATHNPLSIGRGLTEAVIKPTTRQTVGRFIKKGSMFEKMLEPSDTYRMWAQNNSNITYIDMARNAQKSVKATQKQLGIKYDNPLTAFENMISSSEKATRYQNWIGVYKKEVAKGTNLSKARDIADRASRGNSINFSNSSEIAHFAKIFNPYLNAGIQGSRQLAMSMRDRPISTALKITSTLIAPAMALTYYNLSDPQRAENYARMMSEKPWELENNFVFMQDGEYKKIPLPPGINKIVNPWRNFVESQFIGDKQGFAKSAYETLVAPFNPLGDDWLEIVGNVGVPQFAKPLVESGLNKSFFTGDDLIPTEIKALPNEEQKYDSTPQIFIDIAKHLNTSPLFVQNMVQGYTAGGGTGALVNIDAVRGTETGNKSTLEQVQGGFKGTIPKGTWSSFYSGPSGYETLKVLKDRDSKLITEAVIKDYNSPEADAKALEFNARIDEAIRNLTEGYGKLETGDSKRIQLEMLEGLKIPVENGRITSRSKDSRIKSRQ